MKLNIERLWAMTPQIPVDVVKKVEAQTFDQGPIFDSTLIADAETRALAESAAADFPGVRATLEEVKEVAHQQALQKVVARIRYWLFEHVDKDGRRLAKIIFNRDRIIQVLDLQIKPGQDPTPGDVDKVVAGISHELQWEILQSAASPPPPPPPPPPVRKLEDGSDELRIDATESEMRRANKVQLEDLSRRRGEGSSHRKVVFAFQPMPPEITRKILVNNPEKIEQYRRTYGDAAIDARLQNRG